MSAPDRARDPRRVAKVAEVTSMLNMKLNPVYKREHDRYWKSEGLHEGMPRTSDSVEESALKEGKSTTDYIKEVMES